MEIKSEVVSAIAVTLQRRRKDETFERALGKVIRRSHLSFSDYIEAISLVRERAREERTSLDVAAGRIVSENAGEKSDDKQH